MAGAHVRPAGQQAHDRLRGRRVDAGDQHVGRPDHARDRAAGGREREREGERGRERKREEERGRERKREGERGVEREGERESVCVREREREGE
eukprot:7357135-Prymnesium_polylepis.2